MQNIKHSDIMSFDKKMSDVEFVFSAQFKPHIKHNYVAVTDSGLCSAVVVGFFTFLWRHTYTHATNFDLQKQT